MSKTAFLFPGQGVQKCGMGEEFYRNSTIGANLFEEASERLNLDLKKLCFTENDRLDQTEYTQAALVTTYLAIGRELERREIRPDITAGLSLGEYAAIAMAGAFEDLDAIYLVRQRGILMQNAVPEGKGTMCAVLSLDTGKIEQVLEQFPAVTIANYNCPGQLVITGESSQVREAAEELKKAGARRTVMLQVSGPFHSPWMKTAEAGLKKELEQISVHSLRIPYVANVSAKKITNAVQIPDLLTRQLSAPVRWQQSVETMLADGVETFIEIGPGNTLEGFLKKIDRTAHVLHVSCWKDLELVSQMRKKKEI